MSEHSARLGLNIHRGKSKSLKVNSTITVSVTLGVEAIEEVNHFTHLGRVVDTPGGTKADVKARIGKARVVFLQFKNIWSSNVISLKNKIRIFKYKCQGCSSLRSRDMQYHSGHNKEDTYLCQQLSEKNCWCLVA